MTINSTEIVDVCVMMDANGNFVVHHDEDALVDLFDECHGTPAAPVAVYKLKAELKLPVPTAIEGRLEMVVDEDASEKINDDL
jgi:hypothetical protein